MRHDSLDDQHFAEAGAFDPARWLVEGTSSGAKRVAMPFGSGPRICPGRYLALTEMKMLLAMLFVHFDIHSVDTPDGRDAAEERMSFTMVPVGLTMRLRERSSTPVIADAVA